MARSLLHGIVFGTTQVPSKGKLKCPQLEEALATSGGAPGNGCAKRLAENTGGLWVDIAAGRRRISGEHITLDIYCI